MPLSTSLSEHRAFKALQRLRRNRTMAYAIALGAIAAASAMRWAASDVLPEGLPFITFYPAIVIVTFLGGLGPGLVALCAGTIVASTQFLPPIAVWDIKDVVALTMFFVLSSFN